MSADGYTQPTATAISIPGATTGQNQAPLIGEAKPVRYICGECNAKVTLRRNDVVRCNDCGHRVLYKERTNRIVQFEAR